MTIIPLQLKIKNFHGELRKLTNSHRVMFTYNDDKELFRKCRETQITELIGINKAPDFVGTNLDDDDDEFITSYSQKNTSFFRGNYRNKLVIVLHSLFNDYLPTSVVQHR